MLGAILQSLGGLGLFLLGMSLLTDGLKTLAGGSLRRLLRRWTHTPTSGAMSGALVTAIVQSSSATTVTAVGLVGAGILTFPHALGVIFGANIGTTMTGWLVAIFGFKVSLSVIAMPMVLVGALIRLLASERIAALGQAIAGFAVIFIGLSVLQEGLAGFEGVVTPDSFPGDHFVGRLQLVGIGILITAITQSSSAGVAMAITAVHTGTIGFGQAAAIVIGMDVGTTITAGLATIGGSVAVKRTGFSHIIYNLLTGLMAFALLEPYIRVAEAIGVGEDPEIFLVAFHTLFNTTGVILILPFAGRFAGFIENLFPSRGPVLSRHLERELLHVPDLALGAAKRTLFEITAWVTTVLRSVLSGSSSPTLQDAMSPMTDALSETRLYIEELSKPKTQAAQARQAVDLMYVCDHLERLQARLASRARIVTIAENDELREAAAKLDPIAEKLGSWVRDPSEGDLELEAEQVWRGLQERMEDHRRELLNRAAVGGLSVPESLRQLDAMRWLVRVANHLWRLIHHLQRSDAEPTRDPKLH